eukprot:TRINITY_DN15200_c0_g1_i1.p1 TRINITY_DN15200_c0_g1~~TRINITY_DN15200_c0_g1_i1.p1  ORF type:complete len:303 (-),score=56.70 TRINITY_DN15200_c0_g1_i1:144-1052(-)
MLTQGKRRLFTALMVKPIAGASTQGSSSNGSNNFYYGALLGGAGVIGLGFTQIAVAEVDEAENGLHAPSHPWYHRSGALTAFDHTAIRRGFQVYQQVCASCHSMEYLSWRHLIDACYTDAEVQAMAAETEVEDGPDDEGNMFYRSGKPSDPLPKPYPNEQAARYANGGANPPDLTLIIDGRENGPNYVFSLLLGYKEPPAGVNIREGLYYNPYFAGGAIAMPKMLVNGGVEYDDGTPAIESQMAKDMVTYLTWAAQPEHDERKLLGAKFVTGALILLVALTYQKQLAWSVLKSRKIVLDVLN